MRGRANETILVVEDDEDVRASTTEMLRDLGYTILEAANARSGLQLLDDHPEIRLLFTDVGLPGGMNGRQLADEARRRRRNSRSCSPPVMRATPSSMTGGSIRGSS